jgi:hypothetical protein
MILSREKFDFLKFFYSPDRSWPGYALNACSANRAESVCVPFHGRGS